MRLFLGFVILLLGLSSAAPEPDYSLLLADHVRSDAGNVTPLVTIESAIGRADRLGIPLQELRISSAEIAGDETEVPPLQFASAAEDLGADDGLDATLDTQIAPKTDDAVTTGSIPNPPAESNRAGELSLADVCNALYTSAQDNGLPVAFFANLIWQESRLRDDAVSAKGAQGIAQFMPETAAENGLADPFDPLRAIAVSARFLHQLRMEFGKLGFVAAAYNAGPHRVAEWLKHGSALPRETRGYVVNVTGLSVEAWRKIAVDSDVLSFAQALPCRNLPAFADLELAKAEQTHLARTKLAEQQAQLAATETAASRKHGRPHARIKLRHAVAERHATSREAAHRPRAGHEKRKSA